MKTVFVFCVLALALPAVLGRIMDRCTLAREMYILGVPKDQLARWTCLAQHESDYNTAMVGNNADGSNNYGIFQINDRTWCQPTNGKFSENICKLSCNELMTDNVQKSVWCAQTILKAQSWPYWPSWHFCNGILPPIDDCF
ncbi:hypothetical protein KR018_010854 [Drosophila ironensis]|nr:hypothetical protein KR018_010854 [Drosophila ironensis]